MNYEKNYGGSGISHIDFRDMETIDKPIHCEPNNLVGKK